MTTRRAIWGSVTALAVAVLLLVAYAALVVPRQIDVEELRLDLPRLPVEWAGQEVAVVSDFQVGMWGANLHTIERIVARVVDRSPAAVLVAGDLLYSHDPAPSQQTATVLELLQPLLDAGLPVVVVLGNHDHETGYADELTTRLRAAGVVVLRNEATALRLPGASDAVYVVGLGARRPGLDFPRVALRDVPDSAARIVLMHNPASFPDLPAGTAPVSFAGHTHCGQIVLPVGNGWTRLELRVEERYVIEGFASQEYGARGNGLYVTCGIGFSRLPLRLGAEPQVVFATLRPSVARAS